MMSWVESKFEKKWGEEILWITRPLNERPSLVDMTVSDISQKHKSKKPEPNRLQGVRILIGEDCADLRSLYQDILQSEGAEVEVSANGEEACAKAQGAEFDLVLMDVNMPKMNGIEATRRLRASGCRWPIVALTADIFGSRAVECKTAGYTTNLYKPFFSEELIVALRHILREQNI